MSTSPFLDTPLTSDEEFNTFSDSRMGNGLDGERTRRHDGHSHEDGHRPPGRPHHPPHGGSSTGDPPPLCFCAGTLIATPSGEVPVERLAVGDRC